MPSLTSEDWQELSRLWAAVAREPASALDEPLDLVLSRLGELLGAPLAVALLVKRLPDAPAGDPLDGWRPVHLLVHGDRLAPLAEVAEAWMRSSPEEIADGLATDVLAGAGTPRCFRICDLPDPERYVASRGHRMAASFGAVDELIACRPVALNLEVFLNFYRTEEVGGRFSARDLALAQASLVGFQPMCVRYILSTGLAGSDRGLSPRERETLSMLLQGRREKEIADALDLAPHTIHQYVKSLYRKYDVSSRAELLSKWLERRL